MYNISNSVSLTGNLGKDVEIISFDNGSKVAKTAIATNHYYKNGTGEKVQEVTWHNIVAWNKTADLMQNILKKGSLVQIEGMLKNDSYKNKDGEIRYASKVKVNSFKVLTPKEEAMPF